MDKKAMQPEHKMLEKLKDRPVVDKVFASRTSVANQPLHQRDINESSIEGTDGCTRGNGQYMPKINWTKYTLPFISD